MLYAYVFATSTFAAAKVIVEALSYGYSIALWELAFLSLFISLWVLADDVLDPLGYELDRDSLRWLQVVLNWLALDYRLNLSNGGLPHARLHAMRLVSHRRSLRGDRMPDLNGLSNWGLLI